MRPRPSWIAVLSVLGLAAGRAWAQSAGEGFVPEEARITECGTLPSTGPFEMVTEYVVVGFLIGVPVIPFVIAAGHLAKQSYESARRWSDVVLAVAVLQALFVAAAFVNLMPRPLSNWSDMENFLLASGWTGVVSLAAFWLSRTARERAANPPALRAGARIRIREAPEAQETPVAP